MERKERPQMERFDRGGAEISVGENNFLWSGFVSLQTFDMHKKQLYHTEGRRQALLTKLNIGTYVFSVAFGD